MLVTMRGSIRRRWGARQIALLLLLAWAPTLLFVDHWPTPTLVQGFGGESSTPVFHEHGPSGEPYVGLVPVAAGDAAVSHADHGHGSNGAQSGASPVLVVPDGTQMVASLMSWAMSAVAASRVDGEILAPPSPPPR